MNIRVKISGLALLIIVTAFAGLPGAAFGQDGDSKDAFVGAIEKIDKEAKVIYVRSKDGVVKAFKWTAKTTAHGIRSAAIWTDHEAHVGAHVVIRSLKIAGEETIAGIHWFGAGTVKVLNGSVKFVGKGTKKVAVSVANETTEILEISEHAVVHTGKEIWHGTKKVEKSVEKEVKAGVHIFEKGGKRVVKFIQHL